MKKYKSKKEVFRWAIIIVQLPSLLIIIVSSILVPFLFSILLPKEYGVLIGFFVVIPLSSTLAWLWWSYTVVKWRIWAFENTEKSDWISLKYNIIKRGIAWNEGSFAEKTEIRSKQENQKIQDINAEIEKLQKDNEAHANSLSLSDIKNDLSIPPQTEFFYKKSEVFFNITFLPFFFSLTVYFFLENHFLMSILSLGSLIYTFDFGKAKNVWHKEAQLLISNEGIDIKRFKEFDFVYWKDAKNIVVNTEDGFLYLLVWQQETSYDVRLSLNDYEIPNYEALLYRINVYLKRYEIANPH